jgi:hypothetical protein
MVILHLSGHRVPVVESPGSVELQSVRHRTSSGYSGSGDSLAGEMPAHFAAEHPDLLARGKPAFD